MKSKYNPFEKMSFTYDKCFLCGTVLNQDNTSEEHVYPKWLQGKFELWNKKLDLLNKTTIRYKDLTIPCCKECNGKMSAKLEKTIERAVSAGYDEFIKIDKDIVFLWLNKLSYGMLFKELSLLIDRRNPKAGTIYDKEDLERRKVQYMLLKTVLTDTEFGGKPYSMLFFKIKTDESSRYWAWDNPFLQTFFMRMDDIGIIAHLMDNGCNEEFFLQCHETRELCNKMLEPIQFAEVCAKFQYKSFLFNRTPSYVLVYDDNNKPTYVLSQGMSGNIYDDWDQATYASVLASLWEPWGLKYEDIYHAPDEVLTFLKEQEDE